MTMTTRHVLDHGYVTLVESWGSDARIIESARMSTAKGFQGWGPKHAEGCLAGVDITAHGDPGQQLAPCTCTPQAGDEKLLRFLWENKHHSPFEMAGLTVEVQAPIFVFREWHRHRTQSYNELSARYTPLPDLFYTPSLERLKAGRQSKTNKQGSEAGTPEEEALWAGAVMRTVYEKARTEYERLLAAGVARELARLVIPVAQYSRMRATANLRNWLHFLELRLAVGAQWEIRQYAAAVYVLVEQQFPRTTALFTEQMKGA